METPPNTPGGKRGWAELLASLLFVLIAVAAAVTSRQPHGGIAPVMAAAQVNPESAAETRPTRTPRPTYTAIPTFTAVPTKEPARVNTIVSPARRATSPEPTETQIGLLQPERWKELPVMPAVSPEMRALYQEGLAAGNNPHAFSILGDCQSQPDVFLALYEEDPDLFLSLSSHLQETVQNFDGMFSRKSPTIKDGTTEGALLWSEWNDNPEGVCKHGESPLDCELRTNKPSIVFIHVGTHWEARSERYFTIIIEKVLAAQAVPILVTKADNREKDERINTAYAQLASKYGIPLWNFWASVQHLPDNGMEKGSDMYLSEEGMEVHRIDALNVLDLVWRSVR